MNRHTNLREHRHGNRLSGIVFAAVFAASLNAVTLPEEAVAWTTDVKPRATRAEHDVAVRFRLRDERARSVQLAGSFSRWEPRYALRRDRGGDWTVTVWLKPGRYEYMFVIDGGRWIADPAARGAQDSGLGGKNSVIVVTATNVKGGSHAENS